MNPVPRSRQRRPARYGRPPYDEIDIASQRFWSLDPARRDAAFAELRRERPVSWQRPLAGKLVPADDEGFWALVKHADIVAATRGSAAFAFSDDSRSADGAQRAEADRFIRSVFTPRRIAHLEQQIRKQAKLLVDALTPLRNVDFVAAVSSQLPVRALAEMFGIPAASTVGIGDVMALHQQAHRLIHQRRSDPRDDVVTALVTAGMNDAGLTDAEIAAFLVRSWVGLAELTTHAASHAMKALCDFPDQRRLLMADFENRICPAIEEFLRWASPVMTSSLRATADVEIGGQHIAAGDTVAAVYVSGNRDEDVFTDPYRFEVTRSPNDHLAFGRGVSRLVERLVRSQLQAVFTELLYRVPDLQVSGLAYGSGNVVNVIERMPCVFTPVGGPHRRRPGLRQRERELRP